MKKKALLLLVTLLAGLLMFRELGYVEFSFYRSRQDSSSSTSALGGLHTLPLTKEEEGRKVDWRWAEIPRHRIYYTEKCVRPWTRWVPLVKIGSTQIVREFFVTSDKGKILAGKNEGLVVLTAFGSLSAREYSELAEENDRKAFIRWIETRIAEEPNQSPEPTAGLRPAAAHL
jgi:hypothetical protein